MLRISVAARDQLVRGDRISGVRQRQPRRRRGQAYRGIDEAVGEILFGRLRHVLVRLADDVHPLEHLIEAVQLQPAARSDPAVHAVARATAQWLICVLNSSDRPGGTPTANAFDHTSVGSSAGGSHAGVRWWSTIIATAPATSAPPASMNARPTLRSTRTIFASSASMLGHRFAGSGSSPRTSVRRSRRGSFD